MIAVILLSLLLKLATLVTWRPNTGDGLAIKRKRWMAVAFKTKMEQGGSLNQSLYG